MLTYEGFSHCRASRGIRSQGRGRGTLDEKEDGNDRNQLEVTKETEEVPEPGPTRTSQRERH